MLNKPQGEVKLVSDTENGHFDKYQMQEKRQNFTSSMKESLKYNVLNAMKGIKILHA